MTKLNLDIAESLKFKLSHLLMESYYCYKVWRFLVEIIKEVIVLIWEN